MKNRIRSLEVPQPKTVLELSGQTAKEIADKFKAAGMANLWKCELQLDEDTAVWLDEQTKAVASATGLKPVMARSVVIEIIKKWFKAEQAGNAAN